MFDLRDIPPPNPKELKQLFNSVPDSVEKIALIFEQEGKNSIGKKVVLDLSKYTDILLVHRVNIHNPDARAWKLNSDPSLIIVDTFGNIVEQIDGWGSNKDRERFTNILESYVNGQNGKTTAPEFQQASSTTTLYTVPDKIFPTVKDEVFMSDLEKAVQYSITKEVAMQPQLDQAKLQVLVFYIETLLNYLPHMREPMRNFLVSLREWPVLMRYNAISHTEYKRKVNELSQFYQPFAATPHDWKGCAGSDPRFRGYPCSLWTLFHTLTVNAATQDQAFHFGGVSTVTKSMLGYISHFFSCRDCAEHFSSHVSQMGYLPHTGDQSILWLWTIHNTANLMLAGDETEDPMYPKIQWPGAQNCPTCRSNNDRWTPMLRVNGELWNQDEVLNYIKSVYLAKNITKNVKDNGVTDKIKELIEQIGLESTVNVDMLYNQLVDFCRK